MQPKKKACCGSCARSGGKCKGGGGRKRGAVVVKRINRSPAWIKKYGKTYYPLSNKQLDFMDKCHKHRKQVLKLK